MGKIKENKQQKLDALLQSAYELFLSQGIAKTSIDDIVKKAGVAKGTFYLYFRDKYEVRDRLIACTAEKLFRSAHTELLKLQIPAFEDKIIFVVDYILEEMQKNKQVLRFISKNLSWGIFRQAITESAIEEGQDILQFYHNMIEENVEVRLRAPETMLFLIIELASASSYSTILENDPISFEELKPYLNDSIRAIIRNHMLQDVCEN